MYGDISKDFTGIFSREVSELLKKASRVFSRSFQPYYPLIVKSVEGERVTDINGNTYIDFTSGGGNLLICSNHPEIIQSLSELIKEKKIFSFHKSFNKDIIEFIEEVSKISPIRDQARALIVDSRSEAVEAAIRIARLYTGGRMIIGFTGTHHGLTLGAQSISTDASSKWKRFEPAPGFIQVPYPDCLNCFLNHKKEECKINCLDYLVNILELGISENSAGIILQPLRSDGVSPPLQYVKHLKEICEEYRIPLIIDESISAPARGGRWFTLDYYDVHADCVVFASQVSQGLPMGVIVSKSRMLDLEPDSIEPEVGGNLIAITVALTVMKILKNEGLIERAERLGRLIKKRLEELKEELEFISRVDGRGMYIGFQLIKQDKPSSILARELVNECFRNGLLVRLERKSIIVISPPLDIKEEYIEKGLEILEAKLREVSKVKDRL